MTPFLLTISLLLNGISIYFIFILYSRQNRLLEIEKTQDSFKKEIENEISAFLLEMKEENEEFINRFQQLQKAPPQKENLTSKITLEQKSDLANGDTAQMDETNIKNWEERTAKSFKSEAVKVYQKTIANQGDNMSLEKEDMSLEKKQQPLGMDNEEIYRSLLLNQVKILLNQGHTIDEIAKKLNKGKTEIELLLKFG
jgi:hypothetical protein